MLILQVHVYYFYYEWFLISIKHLDVVFLFLNN